MSCGARPLSKPMEAFISSMISAGEAEKRPPHILLAGLSVTALALRQGPVETCSAKEGT